MAVDFLEANRITTRLRWIWSPSVVGDITRLRTLATHPLIEQRSISHQTHDTLPSLRWTPRWYSVSESANQQWNQGLRPTQTLSLTPPTHAWLWPQFGGRKPVKRKPLPRWTKLCYLCGTKMVSQAAHIPTSRTNRRSLKNVWWRCHSSGHRDRHILYHHYIIIIYIYIYHHHHGFSCLFVAGLPTNTVCSQNFQTFSTHKIAFLVAMWPMPAMLLRLSASVCRRYRSWPHWQWNRYGLRWPKPWNTTSWRLIRRANNNKIMA